MINKVQVIVFAKKDLEYKILLFKRSDSGTWQPITGGVEDGEAVDVAALRESGEEAGINSPIKIISNIHTFTFINPPTHRRAGPVTEYVYAYEVSPDFVPVISEEHSEVKWLTFDEALKVLPKEDQKISLLNLKKILNK